MCDGSGRRASINLLLSAEIYLWGAVVVRPQPLNNDTAARGHRRERSMLVSQGGGTSPRICGVQTLAGWALPARSEIFPSIPRENGCCSARQRQPVPPRRISKRASFCEGRDGLSPLQLRQAGRRHLSSDVVLPKFSFYSTRNDVPSFSSVISSEGSASRQ